MKKFFLIFLLLISFGGTAVAYEVLETQVVEQYEPVMIGDDIEVGRIYLGKLNDFPIMYEVNLTSTSTLIMQLKQPVIGLKEPVSFGLMVVRQDERGGGVSEILRFTPKNDNWQKDRDSDWGLSFWGAEEIVQVLPPGIYKIEVSTPNNVGDYMLILGNKAKSTGYFEKIGQARQIQKFMGHSIFKIFTSALVFYPIAIILILFAINRTWKHRKTIAHVD